MRPFFTPILLGLIALTLFAFPAGATPYRHTPSSLMVTQIDSFIDPAAQRASQLVAMTKAGYYSVQVVIDANLNATCNSSLCGTATPLPVKLIEFSGQRLDATQVQLIWMTSAEINNDHFSIERSANPANGFEGIGSVRGRGSSAQNVAYQFTDSNRETDYTYYRLKQVDLDGNYSYSQIIAVKGVLSVLAVLVFPNPAAAQQINVRISGVGASDNVSVVVYDEQGRTLHQQASAVLDADQQVGLPASLKLSPGRYYVKVKAKNQQATSSFMIRP